MSGKTAVPSDVSNGIVSILLKNLAPGASAVTHVLTFTPQPRVLELHLAPEAADSFWIGREKVFWFSGNMTRV